MEIKTREISKKGERGRRKKKSCRNQKNDLYMFPNLIPTQKMIEIEMERNITSGHVTFFCMSQGMAVNELVYIMYQMSLSASSAFKKVLSVIFSVFLKSAFESQQQQERCRPSESVGNDYHNRFASFPCVDDGSLSSRDELNSNGGVKISRPSNLDKSEGKS